MAKVDTVIKNGKVVTPTATYEGVGIAIQDGKFAAILEDDLLPEAKKVIDAQGLIRLKVLGSTPDKFESLQKAVDAAVAARS